MFKRIIQVPMSRISCMRCTLSQLTPTYENNVLKDKQFEHGDSLELPREESVLGPLSEDISHITTYLKPTYNFAAYANKSEIIQELVKLEVNLHYIERKVNEAIPFILRLKFEDIKDHILFLNHLGVDFKEIGNIVTKNPFIFKECLEDFEVRINYLKSKRFSDEMISRIVSKNPFWLSCSTQDIDQKLGFFQANFDLLGGEVRQVAATKPQLITFSQEKVKLNIFVIKEEMGFSPEDMKKIILKTPKIFMSGQHKLLKSFEYLHNTMQISHEQMLETPQILTCRERRLKERHQFLVKLRRDQFDPKKPNYISLLTMVTDTDANFAIEVTKSSIEEYNIFLKAL